MQKRIFGRTGIEVSEISFGTVSLGLPYGIGVHGEADMPLESDSIALLNEAVDKGMNFFDTAIGYGKSEQILGKAFKDRRGEVVICSKPAHFYDKFKGEILPNDAQLSEKLESSITKSLKQLQTNYIDVYMSHDGTEEVIENETVIAFFQQLKQKGIIRATGISVYTLEQSLKAINSDVWDVIQLQFNLMDQTQLPAIKLAAEKGVGTVIRSVLFKGILTDRGEELHSELRPVADHRQKYLALLDDNTKTLAEFATKFVLSYEGVSSVLVGIDKPEYLNQALAVVDGKYLNAEILEKAKALAYPEPEFLNLPMWDRKGWL